jgi:hypothetical protein
MRFLRPCIAKGGNFDLEKKGTTSSNNFRFKGLFFFF